MKQEFIGVTPIQVCNQTINKFMNTDNKDYFNNTDELQKAVDAVRNLGYQFDIEDCEAFISGKGLEPANIPVLADTTREATFLALEAFAKLKNSNEI